VTTRVFPTLKHDRLALKLNGKDDNLRRAEFVTLATTAGLRATDAERAIDEMSQRLRGAIDRIALPSGMEFSNDARKKVAEMLHICRTRLETIR
jgi:serine/threonine-protein kinase HipA